jgi:hypothetical protein
MLQWKIKAQPLVIVNTEIITTWVPAHSQSKYGEETHLQIPYPLRNDLISDLKIKK